MTRYISSTTSEQKLIWIKRKRTAPIRYNTRAFLTQCLRAFSPRSKPLATEPTPTMFCDKIECWIPGLPIQTRAIRASMKSSIEKGIICRETQVFASQVNQSRRLFKLAIASQLIEALWWWRSETLSYHMSRGLIWYAHIVKTLWWDVSQSRLTSVINIRSHVARVVSKRSIKGLRFVLTAALAKIDVLLKA